MADQDTTAQSEPQPQQAQSRRQKREPVAPLVRKRLQKCFDAATKQTQQENYDYAIDLLTQCILQDPGSRPYCEAFLINLQKKHGNVKKLGPLVQFKERGARSAVKKALAGSDWDEVLKQGVTVLKVNPWDIPTLSAMATACAGVATECEPSLGVGYLECELLYLKSAVEGAPKDPDISRQLAIALGKWKRFDEAIAFWHRVEQARPNDDEPQRAIASLIAEKQIARGGIDDGSPKKMGRPGAQVEENLSQEERLKRRIARQPNDMAGYHELAQLYLNADRYTDAEGVYAKALEVNNDPDLREQLEDVKLRNLRFQMAATEKRFRESGDAATKTEFERVRNEILDKELALFKARCERYPNNLGFRYEVALRYKLKGEFNHAIRELQTAKNDPRRKGVCLLALGECFQNIKQYPLAMRHYEEAIQEIPDRDQDNKKKALYRAGKLGLGMATFESLDFAEKHFSTLAGMDFSYRDVAKMLEKIQEKRRQLEEEQKKRRQTEDQGGGTGQDPDGES